MVKEIKISIDRKTGSRILEVYTLDFISDRNHRLGWFGLHFRHFAIKMLLKWADKVYVPDCTTSMNLVRYYFYPRENIVVDRTILTTTKTKSGKSHPQSY